MAWVKATRQALLQNQQNQLEIAGNYRLSFATSHPRHFPTTTLPNQRFAKNVGTIAAQKTPTYY